MATLERHATTTQPPAEYDDHTRWVNEVERRWRKVCHSDERMMDDAHAHIAPFVDRKDLTDEQRDKIADRAQRLITARNLVMSELEITSQEFDAIYHRLNNWRGCIRVGTAMARNGLIRAQPGVKIEPQRRALTEEEHARKAALADSLAADMCP